MPISLDPISYAQHYELRKNASTMTSAAINWFEANSAAWLTSAKIDAETVEEIAEFSVLSIGTGEGDIDFAVINTFLCQRFSPEQKLKYIAIEPNSVHCQRFKERLTNANFDVSVDVSLRQEYFGSPNAAELNECFDLIILAHSLYYFQDPYAIIQQALALTKAGGMVVLVHQTDVGIPQIRRELQYNTDEMMPAAEVKQLLDQNQQPYTYCEIETTFEVTECLKRSAVGFILMSFCLEYDVRALNEKEMGRLLEAFAQGAEIQDDDRAFMPESIGIFTLESTRD